MNRIRWIALGMILAGATAALAQIAISQLPTAGLPLGGTEILAGVQNGGTVKIPAWQMLSPYLSVSGGYPNIPNPYGLVVGSPIGGNLGAGTINSATGFFQNSVGPIIGNAVSLPTTTGGSSSLIGGDWSLYHTDGVSIQTSLYGTGYPNGSGGLWVPVSSCTPDTRHALCIEDTGSNYWQRNYQGAINLLWFGAYGDWNLGASSHDDSAAAAGWLAEYSLGALYAPTAPNGGYKILTSLSVSTYTSGTEATPLTIYGDGGGSNFIVDNSTGFISITGSCAQSGGGDKIIVRDITLTPTSASTSSSSYGIEVTGVAGGLLTNISVNRGSSSSYYIGYRVLGYAFQQGWITGGSDNQGALVGISLNDGCNGVSSNSNTIGQGLAETVNNTTSGIGIELTGGAANNTFIGGYVLNAEYGLYSDLTTVHGGGEPNNLISYGFEDNGTYDIDIVDTDQRWNIDGVGSVSTAGGFNFGGNATVTLERSLFDGPDTIGSTVYVLMHDNILNGSISNSAICSSSPLGEGFQEYNDSGSGAVNKCNPQTGPVLQVYYEARSATVTSGQWTKIPFDTTGTDTGSYWSASNHNYLPLMPGVYQVCVQAALTSGTTLTGLAVAIGKNGAPGTGTTVGQNDGYYQLGTILTANGNTCADVSLNGSSDTIEGDIEATGTGTLTLGSGGGTIETNMSLNWLHY